MELDDNLQNADENDLNTLLYDELEGGQRALDEVNMQLEHSQIELVKLVQRNTATTTQLQQIQANFENVDKNELRVAYNTALDAQQRMLVMRGQLEKLQEGKLRLLQTIELIKHIQNCLSSDRFSGVISGDPATHQMMKMVIEAQEADRHKLSRQMHDGPVQSLSNFIVQTEIATRTFDIDPVKAKEELNNLRISATNNFQKIRNFVFGLRPIMLDDLGLFPTMRRYVEAFKEQSGIDVKLEIIGKERRLEPFIEIIIFRAVQELLHNAVFHNQINLEKPQIAVNLKIDESHIYVNVNDDGKGFDPLALIESRGFGLKMIQDRVEMLGGTFQLNAGLGQGCQIIFTIPIFEKNTDEPFIKIR